MCSKFLRYFQNSLLEKKLDIGVAETLVDTECCTVFELLLVLGDLFGCKLGDEFKTWLDTLNRLGLKDTCGDCLVPDIFSIVVPDKHSGPSVRGSD